MLRKNLVYLALFCLLTLIIGCEHKDVEIEELGDEQIVPTASTIIGKQLENPYSIENMKKALMELENESGLKSANTDEFEIETTHLYVRFLPKTEEQLNILKKDTLLNIFDYPLDYEILEEGLYYHDPSLPDSTITWQYTVVKPDYNFPEIDYEVLSELFIIEDSEDSVEVSLKSGSISASSWLALEDKALEITGNLEDNDKNIEESTLKGWFSRKSKWRPAGRITANGRPIVGCMVRARRWFTIHRGYTNSNGEFSCDGRFRRDANYSIKWERYYWDIRSGTWGQAYYNGPKKRGDWNLNITGGKSLRYAFIHQAAYDYFYRNPFGTQKPFEKKWYRSTLKIGYYDKYGENKSADFAKWRNWFTFPHIRIYKGQSSTASTTSIYASTIHELAHSAHWQLIVKSSGSNRNSDFNFADKKMKESWARGVQRSFTRHFISSSYNPSYHGDYTAVVNPLLALGYSLKELENALVGASSFNEWRDNIKNKYNKSYENQVDGIFSRY